MKHHVALTLLVLLFVRSRMLLTVSFSERMGPSSVSDVYYYCILQLSSSTTFSLS